MAVKKKKAPAKSVAKKSTAKRTLKKKADNTEVRSVQAEIMADDEAIPYASLDTPLDTPLDAIDTEPSETEAYEPEGSSDLAITPREGAVASKDPLTLYLQEIRKYPVLTREQEQDLAKRYYETKDPQLAQTLVKSNLRFVVKIAAEYAKFSSKLIDVIQEGNVGLMHAVKEFNPYKGNRLITYAVWWIRGYIQEYLMRQFSMVRIGTTANQRKLFYQLQRQKQELESMSSPESVALLSSKLGIPEDEITEMAKRLSSRDISLDKPASNDDESSTPLSNLLKKEDGSLPLDEQMALDEQLNLLMNAVNELRASLTEKERILLEERVLSDDPLTLQEIGDKYGITREAVRQTEARLMKKIREAMLAR
ncbi:RNA polymerase factor sigma-32 [Pseudobdellovibrio exovorus]|uniref:RNA polymerase sigma-32 factor n=1 Tax=Pseudobdellovibrio exovorus JSS TaxID=1184267 RepID=M4V6K3_9BACT|nr:RNA polymerase factor sigma-32 [Pseudobdellovibrio exovorus]AGH94838.1 RNA polymerase sigma-32 factor [Pseudobdellovibrio exovorus JSS]